MYIDYMNRINRIKRLSVRSTNKIPSSAMWDTPCLILDSFYVGVRGNKYCLCTLNTSTLDLLTQNQYLGVFFT